MHTTLSRGRTSYYRKKIASAGHLCLFIRERKVFDFDFDFDFDFVLLFSASWFGVWGVGSSSLVLVLLMLKDSFHHDLHFRETESGWFCCFFCCTSMRPTFAFLWSFFCARVSSSGC